MNKTFGIFILCFLVAGALVGCTSQKSEPAPKTSAQQNQSTSPGITVNHVSYQLVSEGDTNIPERLHSMISKKQGERGFASYNGKDGLYIYVSSGKKSSGGYQLQVRSVEDNEGKTNVYVKETSPQQGMFSTQVLTYPTTIIKVMGATSNVHVYSDSKETNEKEFKELK